jgi:hypothetical protein
MVLERLLFVGLVNKISDLLSVHASEAFEFNNIHALLT